MKADRFTWSPERIAELLTLWAQGRSCSEIVAIFDYRLTRSAVIGKIDRLRKAMGDAPGAPAARVAASKPRSKPMNVVTHAKPKEPKEPKPSEGRGPGRSDGSFIALQSGVWLSGNKKGGEVREIEPDAFDKMTARPWEERRDGECKWPFGPPEATLSCCRPVARSGYCLKHADLAFLKRTRTQSQADAKLMAFILKRVA